MLNEIDYHCAYNSKFKELYLDEQVLIEKKLSGYINRFDRIRKILNCRKDFLEKKLDDLFILKFTTENFEEQIPSICKSLNSITDYNSEKLLLKFEDIFCLPEQQIQQILTSSQQPQRGFYLDRYVVTVLFANNGLLHLQDYWCAKNPRFLELYLNDNILMQVNVSEYINRFIRLRDILDCQKISTFNYGLYSSWISWSRKMKNSNGWDVIEIQPGTILYRGIDAKIDDNYTGNKEGFTFYADLKDALWYAFSSSTPNRERGKVITVTPKQPIYLLDMESIDNYNKLYNEKIKNTSNADILEKITYAFGYNPKISGPLKRNSIRITDLFVAKWFCNQSLDGINGWGYYQLPNSHEEIMICNAADKLTRLSIEYRFSENYKEAIIETYNGEAVKIHPINEETILGGKIGGGYWGWGGPPKYKPDINKQSDKWLYKDLPDLLDAIYKYCRKNQ